MKIIQTAKFKCNLNFEVQMFSACSVVLDFNSIALIVLAHLVPSYVGIMSAAEATEAGMLCDGNLKLSLIKAYVYSSVPSALSALEIDR